MQVIVRDAVTSVGVEIEGAGDDCPVMVEVMTDELGWPDPVGLVQVIGSSTLSITSFEQLRANWPSEGWSQAERVFQTKRLLLTGVKPPKRPGDTVCRQRNRETTWAKLESKAGGCALAWQEVAPQMDPTHWVRGGLVDPARAVALADYGLGPTDLNRDVLCGVQLHEIEGAGHLGFAVQCGTLGGSVGAGLEPDAAAVMLRLVEEMGVDKTSQLLVAVCHGHIAVDRDGSAQISAHLVGPNDFIRPALVMEVMRLRDTLARTGETLEDHVGGDLLQVEGGMDALDDKMRELLKAKKDGSDGDRRSEYAERFTAASRALEIAERASRELSPESLRHLAPILQRLRSMASGERPETDSERRMRDDVLGQIDTLLARIGVA